MATIAVEKFREYVEQGLITCRKHPEHDLVIWNYTAKCQYEQIWNDITMQARGLITTIDGTIIGRPFRKFFSLEQITEPLPLEPFKVTDKMDGSLLIVTSYQGQLITATRGSFSSEQAEKAREIIQKKYTKFFEESLLTLTTHTMLFEVVYPQNRIVVDYGNLEDIILLAIVETETGKELDIQGMWFVWPFPIVGQYTGITDVSKIKALGQDNSEGFVVRFENGFRFKIKLDEYVRLHRLITQVNARVIWDLLRNEQPFHELLERVPDEFFTWVDVTKNNLLAQFEAIEEEALETYERIRHLPSRKEQALALKDFQYKDLVFRMLDGKDYRENIWKLLRPAAERPFREDEEG